MASQQMSPVPVLPETPLTPERLAKIITFTVPVVYAFGFVVLSLYEAEFGIADFDFLKIKALATGLLFAFFIGFPALLGIRSFRLFGFQHANSTKIDVGRNQEFYFYAMKVFDLFVSSTFSALILQFLFAHSIRIWITDPPIQVAGHFSWLILATGVVSFLLWAMVALQAHQTQKYFSVKPLRCTALVLLVDVAWVLWTLRMSDWLFFQLNAWCWFVSLFAWRVGSLVRRGVGFKSRTWEIDIVVGFALSAGWFATNIYSQIKPAFGGGAPITAKLYLQDANPVLGTKVVDSYIVEETELGYYIAKPYEHKKGTLFIPRSTVTSVQLGESLK